MLVRAVAVQSSPTPARIESSALEARIAMSDPTSVSSPTLTHVAPPSTECSSTGRGPPHDPPDARHAS
ncbi:hypothetical protein EAH85_05425 [Curtobacterium flaccumfaciens]|nr:hypothetical protein EAH85_05425 [Curtobacterium flaccumfaciens]